MAEQIAYGFDDVWGDKTPEVTEEIITFWLGEKALPTREAAEKRLEQVVYIVREPDNGAIVAVSTVYRQMNQRLGHPFYYFRCFVTEAHRRQLLAAQLLVRIRDKFNARFLAGEDPKAIGMIVEVENQALNERHRKAVWDHSGFVFIGYNQRSQQVRVFYFDGARI